MPQLSHGCSKINEYLWKHPKESLSSSISISTWGCIQGHLLSQMFRWITIGLCHQKRPPKYTHMYTHTQACWFSETTGSKNDEEKNPFIGSPSVHDLPLPFHILVCKFKNGSITGPQALSITKRNTEKYSSSQDFIKLPAQKPELLVCFVFFLCFNLEEKE